MQDDLKIDVSLASDSFMLHTKIFAFLQSIFFVILFVAVENGSSEVKEI